MRYKHECIYLLIDQGLSSIKQECFALQTILSFINKNI